ncbi:MAG: hypothetical protein HZRFUVUK_001036 [Candidatus Fervidibacterota bacterium]|jgi:hypothetical protein
MVRASEAKEASQGLLHTVALKAVGEKTDVY